MSARAIDPQALDKIARLGMSPRQQELNRLFSYYRCSQYEARKMDWNGHERAEPLAREVVATAGFLPPGFQTVGEDFPLAFRRPTAPYNMVKVIVDRFTGLLFSERRHPQLRVEGDPDTEDFIQALAEASRLWPMMIQARQYGGSMGTVAVGFKFVDGRPVVEVHDPRWLIPDFADRETLRLKALEKRYMYPKDERDGDGRWHTVWYWYRRVITAQTDTVYDGAPVADGEAVDWDEYVTDHVEHGLGFCPAVWVQNLPVQDSEDGDPDCHGVYDMVETIDALIAQANRGTLSNCDPSVHIATDMELGEVKKGSDNAIKTEKGGSVGYLEISGMGPKAAMDLVQQLRAMTLEVAQCVLENATEAGGDKTATEIERRYESMLAKSDILREQYGERCVKPLLQMMVKAAKALDTPRAVPGQGLVRQTLDLPLRVQTDPDTGAALRTPRKLGPGGPIKLQWPTYFEPSLTDTTTAVNAAVAAKAGAVVDDEVAAKFIAPFFRVEDVPAMLRRIKQKLAAIESELTAATAGVHTPPHVTPANAPGGDGGSAPPHPAG